jgi:hypothetical protein
MTPTEIETVRRAAVELGRKQRREQGIPERIDDPELTARLAGLLRTTTEQPDRRVAA